MTPRLRRCSLICLFALGIARVWAADSAPRGIGEPREDEAPLVVVGGQFTRDGQTVPATLRNLINVVQRRYRDTNITLIGVDEVPIRQLTLNWGRRLITRDDGIKVRVDPPMIGILTAFAEAADRRFEAVPFSEHDYVLRPPQEGRHKAEGTIRVFNLAPIVGPQPVMRELESRLHDLQLQRKVIVDRYSSNHQDVAPLDDRIRLTEMQLAEATKPAVAVEKQLEQIQELVTSTLQQFAPDEKAPAFKYHAGSHLLIVVGSDKAMDVTRMIIDALAQNR